MILKRKDLIRKMNEASMELLWEKGYISFVDVLMRMGKLKREDYENWRFLRMPYLERVIMVNLPKINYMLRDFHENSRHKGLKPSKTAYVSWGKGPKRPLRFSKSNDPKVEAAYSTHFLKPREGG